MNEMRIPIQKIRRQAIDPHNNSIRIKFSNNTEALLWHDELKNTPNCPRSLLGIELILALIDSMFCRVQIKHIESDIIYIQERCRYLSNFESKLGSNVEGDKYLIFEFDDMDKEEMESIGPPLILNSIVFLDNI